MNYRVPSLKATALAMAALTQALTTWDAAYEKALADLASLTQSEKVGVVSGITWEGGPCVGNTYAPESIAYPSLCLQDGPLGIRFANPVTAFPAGINAGATWDRELLRARGAAMGEEAKGLGVHVQLAPVAGALGKIPSAGRNWEGFTSDPYLSGIAMAETIHGMQGSGVQACAKHYILNEQEHSRETISSNVDDRTMHEVYLWPFYDAVKANVASVMCSYNKINGTWACENEGILDTLLKQELGFRGYVMSDWNAQHSTVASANTGLDMTMPGSDFSQPPGSIYWNENLAEAVANGSVPQARVDDMVTRILAAWYLLEQDQGYPAVAFDSRNGGKASVDVTADHADIARTVARDSIVLLKNSNNTLPLRNPSSIAVVGSDAIVNPDGPNACTDRGCNVGTLAQGWGSGTAEFPYLVAPLDAIQERSSGNGTKVVTSTTDDATAGADAAASADIAIVFISSDSGEGYITVEGHQGDRNNLDPWHGGNDLVKAVAAVNKKTIVVVHSTGPVVLETILAQPNVVAVVWAGIPGQESGNALADVLYGDVSPSGKLPYTIGKSEADYGTTWVANGADDDFPEGLFIDYRHFDKNEIEPRYEFGFGLSYTRFNFSNLAINIDATSGPTSGAVDVGGAADLYDSVGTISATVTNVGGVSGAEVAQLYIGFPSSAPETPPKQLRGFQKLPLAGGADGVAEFELTRRDISYWDVGQQKWVVPEGSFQVYVGASSRDIRLDGSFTV
ncbi:beta-glucosidase [Aspergillus terreus NIH2624]|uniref:Probable beta-glucosidase L n=1 Tax=Aspergillus terreus (strain NIH 2624 / FGSC A1156) TaxID=341663 RepID=BGLL_ASPTN|nr:beta-glucosidase [Aspergillus terreus NIH2624]Q0CEF3.1 RecName: Full=Probable beta-glucosidase L; AltName: Full=Beta-D-glucoside glucohydrolase L; AltName: Full=Cellobiase L; AltName: Full=Gentiobiase L; Flags: Precursor [Aspergillus terreus NIH2624]EAU32193.1 beta-glucosidase [Aspergillus terreus NIH2624]